MVTSLLLGMMPRLGGLVLVLTACAPAPAAPAGPFALAEPTVDFGTVFEGQVLAHEWSLTVLAPVAVSASRTDCGCTLASLERVESDGARPYELGTPLAPSEHLRVSARYDTRGRRGPATRAVTLTLADGGVQALTLQADVRPWLRCEPEDLAFARVLEGQPAERSFEIRAHSGEAFGLTATGVALPPWVTVELSAVAPDARGRATLWRGRVRLSGEAPCGTFNYPVELVSDVTIPDHGVGEPRTHALAPSWTLQVVGPVALSSPNLEFGLVDARETVARSLQLESFEPGFSVADAHAHLEPLHSGEPFPLARTAQVHTRSVGQACEIELTLAGLDAEVRGTFLALLVVETGHPSLPRLQALVRGVRAPEGVAR